MKLSREHRKIIREVVEGHLRRGAGELSPERRAALVTDMATLTEAMIGGEPSAAVDFPAFVADLVGGTFEAVVDASIQQMDAYADLVAAVAHDIDAFAKEATPSASKLPEGRPQRLRLQLRRRLAGASRVDIDLPDLDDQGGDIIADNILAIAVIYATAELEDLRLFNVIDRIVEQFLGGQLPLDRGDDSESLLQFHRDAPTRLSETERRALYDRVLGDSSSVPRLWRDFLVAVDKAAPIGPPPPPSPAALIAVATAGRALAHSASEHGSKFERFAAIEFQKLTHTCLQIVRAPGIQTAFGVRDPWQLVERVASQTLGAAPPIPPGRERMVTGTAIFRWLADHATSLDNLSPGAFSELAEQVRRWLAAASTGSAWTRDRRQ